MSQGGMVDQLRDSEGFGGETKKCRSAKKHLKNSTFVRDDRIISIIPIFFRVWINKKSG